MIKQADQKHVVIITDDSVMERERVKCALGKATNTNVKIYEAESKEGIVNIMDRLACDQEFPSIVILDFILGAANGLTVTSHLRKNYPPIPIVVLGSCLGSEPNITQLYRMGVNAYMIKPQTQAEYDTLLSSIANIWLHIPQPKWGKRKADGLEDTRNERRRGSRRDYDRRCSSAN